MIKSMTGYGTAKGNAGELSVTVELKSVNNRFLDVNVKLPRNLMFAEETLKSAVGRHTSRGKVDMFVTVDSSKASDVEVRLNEPLLREYLSTLEYASTELGLSNDITVMRACALPEVMSLARKEQDTEALSAAIAEIAENALNEYDKMRVREGEKLRDDVLGRIETIRSLTAVVEEKAPETVAEYRARLEEKIRETISDRTIDETRLLTEVAIFADRVAVDEETVRLRSHLAQLTDLIKGESPVGRKMDFLIQELNREANTIGSKCQSAEIARTVVELKSEIEKIREQIQNVE